MKENPSVIFLNNYLKKGELGLLHNKPRTATIKCHTDCEFAILEKKDFNKSKII